MVDSVAVLADVHCVLPALEAVLAEPDVRSADLVVFAGDVAVGPQPVETIDAITGLGDRAVWVRGNCDRITVEYARSAEPAGDDPTFAVWGAKRLRPDQVELMDRLPKTVTVEITGLGEVLFCHATPRDDEEYVLVDSGIPRWKEILEGVPPTVTTVVCGHTHMPFMRLVDRTVVVNPGSVGMPYGTTGAHWALLGGDGPAIQLRRTLYDIAEAEERIRETCDHPRLEEFLEHYVRHNVSDVEALETFTEKLLRGQ